LSDQYPSIPLTASLPAQPNQGLIDGLACLQGLASGAGPVGSRELARRLGLEPTRVNRLLKTLAHLGIAAQTADRRYVPGPGMHVLAAQSLFGSGLIRQAVGPLEELHRLGLAVALGVLWRREVCYLYHALPGAAPATALGRVGLYPAERSGIGLALLATRPDDAVRALYADRGPAGFGSTDTLIGELRRFRAEGVAVATRETHDVSVGVPLGEPAYAAVALAGAITHDRIPHLADVLRSTAAAIVRAGATESPSPRTDREPQP
jgi:DNA-binding IclR family transcriptional regulator